MSRFAWALASLLALALSAPAAAAKVMSTAPGFGGVGSDVQCVVQNLDTKEHTVTARILLPDGVLIAGPTSFPVAANNVVVLLNIGGHVYCQFEGLSRKVRGWLTVIDSAGTRVMLPAVK